MESQTGYIQIQIHLWVMPKIHCEPIVNLSWTYREPQDMSEIYAHPLPRVYAIFLFAIEYSAKAQHITTAARAGGRQTEGSRLMLLCVEPWLNAQWQAEE